ncbi:Rpn family recombination-promoting nuclease/putative transposase [Petrotoga sp. 9PWA.NaAc.5.4]|uniref:Rpn family recombination-promoting nuclease/putative transposase n=1 Tax=Petrotoga sp. 9PWA.NaAc.5.4 TaxID=1434328 RepID=UPI000CB12290|nr:Rpn family recombination-promoting nuclease/putative transposase [Petrotoga sp. 9PWA.NaAc.5.4]PNR96616.1 hypothetical protein X924_01540 [Petrotoga sp. 9PWA.NaAc.5.4]
MNEINNPHDAFFKRNFGDIEIAKDFLKNYLPKNVAQAIDLEHIEKENGSYVDEEFQNVQSDLLWKTKINNNEGYIYILFEHKSYKDKKVIFQLLKYMLKIWEEKYDKTKNKIPIIIPIVVYHGETIWNIETNLINLIEGVKDIPEGMKRYIPSYEYEIYDFSPKSKAKIAGEAYTRLVIEVMRSAFEKDKERFYKAFKLMVELTNKMQDKEKADEVFEICLKYLLDTKDDIEIEEMEKVAKEESVERGELIMSIAEKLREEGIKKGIEKGIEKGKLEGEKETLINLLKVKYGKDLTKELEEKIRKASEEKINKLMEKFFEITLDELKEILK